jgi:hypothetical protein
VNPFKVPHDVYSPEDLDDLISTIGTRGIDLLEGQPELPSSTLERKFGEEVEAGELDLKLAKPPRNRELAILCTVF